MIRNTNRQHKVLRGLGAASPCGSQPNASLYNGGQPLTPGQQAQWNADYAVYVNCLNGAQGAPTCPQGSVFSGGDGGGASWQGTCQDVQTGATVATINQSKVSTPVIMPTMPSTAAPMPTPSPLPTGSVIDPGIAPAAPSALVSTLTGQPWYVYAGAAAAALLLFSGKK